MTRPIDHGRRTFLAGACMTVLAGPTTASARRRPRPPKRRRQIAASFPFTITYRARLDNT